MRWKILSLIFVVVLCVYPLCAAGQAKVRTFTHVEQQDLGPNATARVYRAKVFDDNTVVLRMVRKNTTVVPKAKQVFYNTFSLRILNPNGTVIEKDITLDIPSFNYNIYALPRFGNLSPIGQALLSYYLIRKNQILVTYFNATDENDYNTYDERGMIIDFDGNKYDEIVFGPAFIDKASNSLTADGNARVFVNTNSEKGFLVLSNLKTEYTQWQQFRVEPNGKFTRLTNGTLLFEAAGLVGTVMSTIDEGYAYIFANRTADYNVPKDPLSAQVQLSMIPIGYNQSAGSSLTLFQTSLSNITFNGGLRCDLSFSGIGQTCVLTLIRNTRRSFMKVDFLSTGSVINTEILDDSIQLPPNITSPVWTVDGLDYGGFLLTNNVQLTTFTKGLYGYLVDTSNNIIPWDFPEPVNSNVEGVFLLLPNNTLMVAQFEGNNTWQFLVIDLPRFVGDKDKGYSNVNVEGTYPQIQNTITPQSSSQISINFYNPVVLSNGYLSIYQVTDDQQFILRQKISANTFVMGNDSRTISANVLESTFSISNGNYFIKFDNGLVRDLSYNEPLLGIRDNIWKFSTDEITEKFAPSTNGLLRLTPNGTIIFDNFSSKEKHDFFENLKNEISIAVPVNIDRLTTNENIQVEKGVKEKQYLVSIGILETRGDNENSAATIIHLVDIMIRNQDQSPIGFGQLAGFLDENYGFERSPNLWEKYRTRLIGLFVVVLIFFILLFFAHKRDGKGNNIAILRIGIILFDLIMDILFVSTNSKDVPSLYIPSVVFVTLPIAINTTLAFYIISEETTKPKFYQWFKKNGNVASLFTLMAGADIEALTILQSKIAGFSFFDAPFSESAETMIFWGAFLNIFTEDIPQVVIQAYYRRKTVNYDIIPLLTLISSSLNLVINIVGRLYQATNRMRFLNINKYKSPNDDADFGGLDNVEVGGKRGIDDDETTERTVKSDEELVRPEKTETIDEKTDEKTDKKTDVISS